MCPTKNILSIDSDDDNDNYEAFSQYLNEDTKRKQARIAKEFDQLGNQLLKEIEKKNKHKKVLASKLIPYILKNCKGKYDSEELNSYSFEDVQNIYNEIKIQKRPAIIKFFHFIFNL
jgi:hypothetical protein